ncbi:fibronectin type III domain-containing protein [Bacillus sp. B2-WWTP-C-10-Post-4]|uniref:fibronectin type III domain-containing protein n=1 Tax=Bacillus sp. B2-WWTP-C-10-Post-4 TaxID=2653218 RepID=UPI001D01A65D|nr:fibronectin type III domain-containing protein [Bacillus sp. B2-WWTP-C-10-Post-4]
MACSKWKMRIKKFLVVVPLLLGILFVGDTSAFAEELPEYVGKTISGRVTYRSDPTGFPIRMQGEGREGRIEFNSPVNISGFSYSTSSMKSDLDVTVYYGPDGRITQRFYNKKGETSKSFVKGIIKGVTKIEFKAPSYDGLYLNSFYVFEYLQPPPNDVSDIKADSVSHNSIKLTYKFPTENFSNVKIFRDGKVISDSYKSEYFLDTGLNPETEYTYKFVSVSPSGNQESKGIEYKVKTDQAPDLTKPSKPSSPILTPKDGSLIVNLTNYNAGVKIKGYHIIVDGKQINDSLVTARSYAVKGLKNGQTYQVQIKAVSAWNVESDLSNSVPGIPQVQVIPDIAFNFGLSDLIESIKNWFGGIWPIVAFSIAIPLAFIVAFNTKKLFLR